MKVVIEIDLDEQELKDMQAVANDNNSSVEEILKEELDFRIETRHESGGMLDY